MRAVVLTEVLMHIFHNKIFACSFLICALSLGCITKVEEKDVSPVGSNTVSISATADSGATISPSSITANIGDRPKFTITLRSGYRIDTVICWVGGSLTRNDDNTYTFSMAPVDRAETVSVRTVRSSGVAALQDGSTFTATCTKSGTLRFVGTDTVLDDTAISIEPVYQNESLSFVHRIRIPSLLVSVDGPLLLISRDVDRNYTEIDIPVNHEEKTSFSCVNKEGNTQSFSLLFK